MESTNIGTPAYVTVTGYQCITSAGAEIYGVLVHGTGTGGFQLFSSNTATAATAVTGPVWTYATVGGATVNSAVYYPLAATFPAGFCVRQLPSADPKLTLFWRPVGN